MAAGPMASPIVVPPRKEHGRPGEAQALARAEAAAASANNPQPLTASGVNTNMNHSMDMRGTPREEYPPPSKTLEGRKGPYPLPGYTPQRDSSLAATLDTTGLETDAAASPARQPPTSPPDAALQVAQRDGDELAIDDASLAPQSNQGQLMSPADDGGKDNSPHVVMPNYQLMPHSMPAGLTQPTPQPEALFGAVQPGATQEQPSEFELFEFELLQHASNNAATLSAVNAQGKRRRRKRDPVTGELLPLDSNTSDLNAQSKRRRRRRDPVTGELLPLPLLIQESVGQLAQVHLTEAKEPQTLRGRVSALEAANEAQDKRIEEMSTQLEQIRQELRRKGKNKRSRSSDSAENDKETARKKKKKSKREHKEKGAKKDKKKKKSKRNDE